MDSVLVADVPVQMRAPKAAADKFGIDSIFIAPPNGDTETARLQLPSWVLVTPIW